MTVDEYRKCSRLRRLQYRLYREPLFMFLIGPSILFILWQRFTFGIPRTWRRERRGVYLTNVGISAMISIAWLTIGIRAFVLVHLPIMVLAAGAGCWLFFVQHQFEEAYWQPHEDWDFVRAACDGSSFYRLPRVLQWFTGNIGFHHIHHLESRIPNYNLEACYDTVPELRDPITFGFWESLKCTKLKLWDEQRGRMVTFADIKPKSLCAAEPLARHLRPAAERSTQLRGST